MGQIYALALRKNVKHPFDYESDEVTVAAAASPSPSPSPTPSQVAETIDFDGIEQRAVKVPLPANNYAGLAAGKGHLVYLVTPPFYYGRAADTQGSLRIFSLKDRKETTMQTPAFGYSLSADGSKILAASAGGSYSLMDASPAGANTKKTVATSGLVTEIDPAAEWNQIFNEAWRRYRDWFYVENMHGFNWDAIREDYKKWLPYVAHRADLNYVIAEMSS